MGTFVIVAYNHKEEVESVNITKSQWVCESKRNSHILPGADGINSVIYLEDVLTVCSKTKDTHSLPHSIAAPLYTL